MRRANWASHLITWATGMVGRPFAWGATDCHALAADAYRVMYGRPLDLPVWADQRGALTLYRNGWALPDALLRLGAEPVPLGRVRCGDLVVEPRTEHFHPVLVALGESRFLTSSVGEAVRIARLAEIDAGAVGWRFA